MARDPHGCGVGQRRLPNVLLGQPLGGDGLLEGHVEVLLPANERIVRAPVGKEHGAVVGQEGHGGKLGLLLRQEAALEQAQPALSEAHRLRRPAQKIHILFRPRPALRVFQREKFLGALAQRHRRFRVSRRLFPVVHIGQGGKNQRVHRVGRVLGKGQVPPPG